MVILKKTRLANRHPPVGIRTSETNCHKACYLRAVGSATTSDACVTLGVLTLPPSSKLSKPDCLTFGMPNVADYRRLIASRTKHKACHLRAKEGVNMFRIVNTKTNGLLFSSNSIYGIIDLFLINWGRLPDFTISIDMTNKIITFNNENYTIEYINIATPPRGEET